MSYNNDEWKMVPMFFARRILYLALPCIFKELPSFQIMSLVMGQKAYLIFIGSRRPY
jgi:hypothetical protein